MTPDCEWLGRFEEDARARGDVRRLRLVQLVCDADGHREACPDRALALIDEGRALAKALGESWWELFYDDHRAGVLMKYKGDVRAGLELAVRNVLRLRGPTFEQFPWRFRVLDHLVVGYLNTDPVGYADEVRAALDHLEAEAPEQGSPRYLLLARRRWLAAELDEVDEAEDHARRGLALAAEDPDEGTAQTHSVFCHSHLCHTHWLRDDRAGMAAHAEEGSALAKETGHQLELAEFQLWQGYLARLMGHDALARRLVHHARSRIARLGMPPDHIYFDALTAYHLAGGEHAAALAARDHELSLLAGRGRWAAECRCRVERCRLQARLGVLLESDREEARAVAGRLRRPGEVLARLEAVRP